MSILVIDDSKSSRLLLKTFLNAVGYKDIILAESAQEALRILEKDDHSGNGGGIEIILMDIIMPEMDGIEATRLIKSLPGFQDIPIVMVTAKNEEEYLEKAYEAGAIDYINKPVKKAELKVRVRSILMLKKEMNRRKAREMELKETVQRLQEALAEVKTLQGFIPICAYCKRIRDDEGFWHQVEKYIQEHSEATFSHAYCPDCVKELYPDLHKKIFPDNQ